MASDDFEVLAFKILSYLYRCMKNGKKVDIAALRQLVGCNETYFGAVVRSLQSKGLVEGFDFDAFCVPRIRGDDPVAPAHRICNERCSPHTRG